MDAPYPRRHRLRIPAAEQRRTDPTLETYMTLLDVRARAAFEREILDARDNGWKQGDVASAPPPRRTHWTVALLNIVCVVIVLVVFVAVFWPMLAPYLRSPAPSVAPAAPTILPVAPPAAAPAAEQAPAAPVADAQPAPVAVEAPVSALPTAAVVIAAPAEVVTVPVDAPLRYAPGSGPAPTAAPAPTIVTTAPMVAGKDFEYSADGACVQTRRGADTVKFCQIRPMLPAEMSSVADFLRTGRIKGEVVQ